MARLFVDKLTVIDFSFLDFERGVVGESWIVDIELVGELDKQGMVFDFGHVKKKIKQYIDDYADHCLLVPTLSPGCETYTQGQDLEVRFPLKLGGSIVHNSPRDAVLLLDSDFITIEHISNDLQKRLFDILPENVQEVGVTLRPEQIDGAYYHYTHGLNKHKGQCQRIAHGHRSRIEIEVDGQRNQTLEQQWAETFKDCYIATKSHVTGEFEQRGVSHTHLQYVAEQGAFSIVLPSEAVFLIPSVSTVENIAMLLADTIAKTTPGKIRVKAFEGVDKGAIGEVGFQGA